MRFGQVPDGYGVVLLYNGREKRLSGSSRYITNNRMELTAAIAGLEALKRPCTVEVYSDSRYVVDAAGQGWINKWRANGWRRKGGQLTPNNDLWERLLCVMQAHSVKFVWVKGHSDNEFNNISNSLANAAIPRL